MGERLYRHNTIYISTNQMEPELPSVADNTNINDARQPKDFKSITFSNYKQTAVRSRLI